MKESEIMDNIFTEMVNNEEHNLRKPTTKLKQDKVWKQDGM